MLDLRWALNSMTSVSITEKRDIWDIDTEERPREKVKYGDGSDVTNSLEHQDPPEGGS